MSPEAYDRVVCAELPDKKRPLPIQFGCKTHDARSMQRIESKQCTYPVYCRKNDGKVGKVRGKILDNRSVIPYNPTLLAQFNCHINVEICCDIKAVKYLYKYVHKGHDKVMFLIAANDGGSEVDEISNHQNARWVLPIEVAWRIYGFPLFGMYPTVLQLQVHLPNFQTIQFEEDTDLEEIL
ncbi:hypothetical protein LIER_27019 [Lithospermum erythrorhizon]|uniref:Uncharacterized protein n=1 Tax=Lithospermum erythrorhizon TaxID=34254 RepID=A0AAV3RAK6_LITER